MATLADRLVDLGGRKLHVVQSGHGAGPAVVLEAAADCWSEHWSSVQQLVGEVTATYSYDRAGHGLSDAGEPWSLESCLADLEAWLSAVPVLPPYVLAGHSLGGQIVRAFAARHPDEVAALVLVDARPERLVAELPRFYERFAAVFPYDADQRARDDDLIGALPGLGDLPLTVITHGVDDWVPAEFGYSTAEAEHCEQVWQRLQHDLAAKSRCSKLRTAATSGHLIPQEQPALVAAEIISRVEEFRSVPSQQTTRARSADGRVRGVR